jgi:hypothetical protein
VRQRAASGVPREMARGKAEAEENWRAPREAVLAVAQTLGTTAGRSRTMSARVRRRPVRAPHRRRQSAGLVRVADRRMRKRSLRVRSPGIRTRAATARQLAEQTDSANWVQKMPEKVKRSRRSATLVRRSREQAASRSSEPEGRAPPAVGEAVVAARAALQRLPVTTAIAERTVRTARRRQPRVTAGSRSR